LRSKVENNRVRISVKDSGKGIDESKIMELFQPFNRLGAEQTEIEGTGIGLCIAKNLVERMGGTIGVSNNKGPGCCFWVEFPIIPPPIKQQNGASETYKKLQEEFNYLQESLNVIGLVKNPQQQTDLANQALDETKADNSTQTLH
jgi:K+-sensing histidine kinase KdpD